MSNTRCFICGLTTVFSLVASAPAQASGAFEKPVDIAVLAGVRGGFSSSDVAVAFNVRQSVYVNGSLTATSGVQVTQDGTQLSAQRTSPALVQVGTGNFSSVGLTGMAAATTIVQNSLDNQKIGTVTTIDVSATILGAYRSLHLQSSLTSAITASLRH